MGGQACCPVSPHGHISPSVSSHGVLGSPCPLLCPRVGFWGPHGSLVAPHIPGGPTSLVSSHLPGGPTSPHLFLGSPPPWCPQVTSTSPVSSWWPHISLVSPHPLYVPVSPWGPHVPGVPMSPYAFLVSPRLWCPHVSLASPRLWCHHLLGVPTSPWRPHVSLVPHISDVPPCP